MRRYAYHNQVSSYIAGIDRNIRARALLPAHSQCAHPAAVEGF